MNNRFKCLLDEEEIPRRRTRERETRKVTVNNFKVKEKQEHKIINNEANFPSLNNKVDNKVKKLNNNKVNYVSMLKNEEKGKKNNSKENRLKKGWVKLGEEYKYKYNYKCKSDSDSDSDSEHKHQIQTKEEKLDEYLYFIDCMVNLYEHQRLEKIEILGEENYERIYKFPNYDYEYFDKLDEDYEVELEKEITMYENELDGFISDNST